MPKDDPTLWQLEFDWQHELQLEHAQTGFRNKTVANFAVESEIARSLAARNSKVTAGAKLGASARNAQWQGTPGGGVAEVASLKVSRRFDTGLPALKVDDDPASTQPAESFRVAGVFPAPEQIASQIRTSMGVQCKTITVTVPWHAEFDFPYRPGDAPCHRGEQDIQDYLARATAKLPPGIRYTEADGQVVYQLQQKALRLEFQPSTADYTRVATYQGMVPLTTTLSYNAQTYRQGKRPGAGETFYVHANYLVQVYVDGQPQVPAPGSKAAPSPFKIWRIARVWEGALDPDSGRCERYTGYHSDPVKDGVSDTAKTALPGGWVLDFNDAKDWVDIPGGGYKRRPSTWGDAKRGGNKSALVEFLVTVRDYPEFRFVYFYFVFDFAKQRYRIRAYAKHDVGLEEAQAIFNSPLPYRMSVDGPIEADCPFCPTGSTADWVTVQDP